MRATLEARRIGVLGTQNEDGSMHLTPVWYLFENDRFYVGMASASRKARNLEARPVATIIVDRREPGCESWVYASGRAEILRGDESRALNSVILRRYLTEKAIDDPRVGPGFAAADDVTMCLVAEKWRSWNSKDVDEQFFGGILGSEPEKWFRPTEP
jgi:PPOX class probable F420-dependent enzyme